MSVPYMRGRDLPSYVTRDDDQRNDCSHRYASDAGSRRPPAYFFTAVTIHNITYQARLMGDARNAILNGTFPNYLKTFFATYFGDIGYPEWCVNALRSVGVDLLEGGEVKVVSGCALSIAARHILIEHSGPVPNGSSLHPPSQSNIILDMSSFAFSPPTSASTSTSSTSTWTSVFGSPIIQCLPVLPDLLRGFELGLDPPHRFAPVSSSPAST